MTNDRPTGLVGPASARAPLGYRALLAVFRFTGRRLFGFRPELLGAERLPRDRAGRPAGGWIAAGLPHRTWIDPLLIADLMPVEPRLVFFGDGPAIFRSPWRRFLVRRLGGVIPIWPRGQRAEVEAHLAAADAVIRAGGVLVIFPEVGRPAPLGEARALGLGVAYLALRTGAPIVPIAIGGTHDLYRGRRLRLEVLEPRDVRSLASIPAGDPLPEPWSRDERAAAHKIADRLAAITAPAVAAAHQATEPPPGTSKRWRWLTTAWQ